MKSRRIFVLAAVFLLLSAMASLLLGAAKLTLPQLWQAVVSGPDSPLGAIFWYARLPRTAACLLAGAALAVSGAMIQGVLGNPLASPGIIGVNAGAGLGVSFCCAAGAVSGSATVSGGKCVMTTSGTSAERARAFFSDISSRISSRS